MSSRPETRSRTTASSRRAAGPESGETLIELLIAVAVLGIGSVAILGGLVLAVDSSTFTRSQSGIQALLRSYADALTDVGETTGGGLYRYVPCAGVGSFPAASAVPQLAVPAGWSVSVSAVTYWNGSSFASTCTTANDTGIQKVRLTATAPAGLYPSLTKTLEVVVRRPCGTTAASASC